MCGFLGKISLLVALLLSCGGISGCSAVPYKRFAAEFRERSPEDEALDDFRSGDNRVYSMMGFAQYYPGLDYAKGREIDLRYGLRLIPHTSDVIENGAHGSYMGAARQFAPAYNQRKLSLLE